LLWALDFNVEPMCSVVAQVKDGFVTVLDEIVLARATTFDACQEFMTRFKGHTAGVRVYADATGARRQTTGLSDVEIVRSALRGSAFGEVLFKVPKSNPAVKDRVNLMNAKLEAASGEAMMRIDPKCKELIQDLEQVSFLEGTSVIDKDKDPKRSHVSDALGYLVWQECGGAAGVGERGRRLL
jgi:hypothetical protein